MDNFNKIVDSINYYREYNKNDNIEIKIRNILYIVIGVASFIDISKNIYNYLFEKQIDPEQELESCKKELENIIKLKKLNIEFDNQLNELYEKLLNLKSSKYKIVKVEELSGIGSVALFAYGVGIGNIMSYGKI